MISEWYREGDFYINQNTNLYFPGGRIISRQHTEDSEPKNTNKVIFKNLSPAITLKKIQIKHYSDGVTEIFLDPSVFHIKELHDLCRQYFNIAYDGERSLPERICLSFQTLIELKKSIPKIFKLLFYLNKKYERQEFSKDILSEFCNIFKFLQTRNELAHKHSISENLQSQAHINPLRKKSTKLVNYLYFTKKPETKVIHALLRQGEDPNQTDSEGTFPLYHAVQRLTVEVVKLLCFYKADFARRPYNGSINDNNAIELTKKYNSVDKFNIFKEACTPLNKILKVPQLTVQNIQLSSHNKEIITALTFTNKRMIVTRLMTSESFYNKEKEIERNAVFKLFSETFKDRLGDEKIFKEEHEETFCPEKNKWIEIFIDQNEKRIIGFNVFRVVENKGELVLKCEYAAIDSHSILRGSGGVVFFPFRIGFALQLLKPEFIVKVYYLAIHYFSYASLQDELITPKFQPKHMIESNQRLVNQDFNRVVPIIDGGYIETRSLPEVIIPLKKKKMSFQEDCFNEFILGNGSNRAAVVSTIAGQGLFNSLSRRINHFLGINFPEHTIAFSECLRNNRKEFLPLLNNSSMSKKGEVSLKNLVDERWPFWTDTHPRLRSRL